MKSFFNAPPTDDVVSIEGENGESGEMIEITTSVDAWVEQSTVANNFPVAKDLFHKWFTFNYHLLKAAMVSYQDKSSKYISME